MKVFKLPDLGEGLQEADIVEWHVNVGDEVKIDAPLVSMETAKAVVEVPSPFEGTIAKLYGKKGDTILTGASLVEFALENEKANNVVKKSVVSENKKAKNVKNEVVRNTSIIVEGIDAALKAESNQRQDTGTVAGKIEETGELLEENVVQVQVSKNSAANTIKATPAIRILAKTLGVDLTSIIPSGPHGLITVKDIQNVASKKKVDKYEDGFEPIKGVRKSMAKAMIASHDIISVSACDDAKLFNWKAKEDITIRIIRAIVAGCNAVPEINSWFNGKNLSRKIIKEINLGIAMDLGEGLFVPVMKDVANKSDKELRDELNRLKTEVKARSISQEDLKDATFTLSNFGKFAGRYANPVIVPPQVAILGAGAIREEVVVIDGEMKISKIMPLALTIDHRALTGGEATRFLGTVIQSLEK